MYEMQHLGRDPAELTALADHLSAHGLTLEMIACPPSRGCMTSGHGQPLFSFLAAMAETERENIRESTLEGLDAADRKGSGHLTQPVRQSLLAGRPRRLLDDWARRG